MFEGLKRPLKEGETFSGTLTFEKAGTVSVTFDVKGLGASPPLDQLERLGVVGSIRPKCLQVILKQLHRQRSELATKPEGLFESYTVANEIVRYREAIIEPPCLAVRLARMPIESRPALVAAKLELILDQRASDALSAKVWGDEQVF